MIKIKELIKKIFDIQGFRFLFVGGLNTIVGYASYALLIFFGFHYVIASTISTIIGIIHSYLWNRNFTFKSKGKIKKEITKFVSVYGCSYLLGLLVLYIIVDIGGLNEYVAGVINLVFTTLISWFGHKYFSFRGNVK